MKLVAQFARNNKLENRVEENGIGGIALISKVVNFNLELLVVEL
jgi:hypothetical protein